MHPSSNPGSIAANSLVIALVAISLSGCEVIGDIFKAGFWTGIVIVAIVVAIAVVVFRALR